MAKKKQANKITGAAPRGARISVPISKVRPNPWNPNEQSPIIKARMSRSMRRFGIVKETLVREVGPQKKAGSGNASVKGYEIIDGEHRYIEAKNGGLTELEVRNLGELTDTDAKELTVILNELSGDPNPQKLSSLMTILEDAGLREDILDVFPYTKDEVDALLAIQQLPEEEDPGEADDGKHRTRPPYQFQIGPHKGALPSDLGNKMDEAYEYLAHEVMTSDPVAVATALCELIEGSKAK